MAEDAALRHLVAFLYQRSGRGAVSESELANALSLDLKWYAPKMARSLVAGLVRAGWLERDEDGDLEAAFDVRAVTVPLGYRPPPQLPDDLPPPGTTTSAPRGAAPGAPAAAAGLATPTPATPAPAAATPAAATPAADAPARSSAADARPGSTEMDADEDEDAPFLAVLLARLAAASGEDTAVWMQRMEQVVRRTDDGLAPEAALLLAAAKAGVDVAPWLPEVRARVRPGD